MDFVSNLGILDALDGNSAEAILQSWEGFCDCSVMLLDRKMDACAVSAKFVSYVHSLCRHGLSSLVRHHFLRSLEEAFERHGASQFRLRFEDYNRAAGSAIVGSDDYESEIQKVLCRALEEISVERQYQEKCLLILVHALQTYRDDLPNDDSERLHLMNKYHLNVTSILMANPPTQFPEILQCCFKRWLDELSEFMTGDMDADLDAEDEDGMDVDQRILAQKHGEVDVNKTGYPEGTQKWVRNIGRVVHDLRGIGLSSMAEEAYAFSIFSLLKAKVEDLAGDEFRISVLDSVKQWVQAVPLQFLRSLLAYLGESVIYNNASSTVKSPLASHSSSCFPGIDTPSEGLVRWQLKLEYFAYETLQDLRIAKLFEIIVDYPDSSPAIEDLKQCLEYTGQHSKLVDSFISALRFRLLTAGASTIDILHQYVSTIKALRTIDPAGIFLESVGEPIRDYLRGRKDTIKCIVTMLTDGSGGNPNAPGSGESLLEELDREDEEQEDAVVDEEFHSDDKLAWVNAQRWVPDPAQTDPSKGSRNRRKVDILGMIVSLIGSKDQLVNEYRVMLAEKLLNKSDYDTEAEIRTLELLKIHFGEGSMQKCEIMLNDLIDSKRTNTNIKATATQPSAEEKEEAVSLEVVDATIISSNFWPSIQEEALNLPNTVDHILSAYAKRYNEIKTPRKLLWKKNLGTVKLELQFEERAVQFTVAPIHAAIIMQFQEQTCWNLKSLSAAVGVPVDVLHRRINFWIGKGILVESTGADLNDHTYTLVKSMADTGKNGVGGEGCTDLAGDEGESSVSSVEDPSRKEWTVYEKFITCMLVNNHSMPLDRIYNSLKMFASYDKSLQQLQNFLSVLISEERLEFRDGVYMYVNREHN